MRRRKGDLKIREWGETYKKKTPKCFFWSKKRSENEFDL